MNHSVQHQGSSGAGFSRALLLWLSVFAWAGLIFLFSAQPSLSTGLGIWDTILRKTAHMVEFAVLTLLIRRAIRQHRVADRPALAAGALLALLYACSDEYHQSFVPGRSASVRDVGFDLVGILLAVSLVVLVGEIKCRSHRKRMPK